MSKPVALELLAPAKNAEIGRIAIDHGADAVYIGARAFGARAAAGNSVDEIRDLCEYAHRFRARVYVTVNTLIYDKELQAAKQLIEELYAAGADALIVQDMGLLRMDLPPIELHASTQCDTRTPEKAEFLQKCGMSQIVLARELTLQEIKQIHDRVKARLEVFVHGALCVSYSGRCHASQALCSRSANRGECAQICRLPYDLTDASGRMLARGKHLLSLHDFNTLDFIEDLVEAGATSFKIEGRLKDADYVKNVTAAYRKKLDEIIDSYPEKYCRASCGEEKISFNPQLNKSFNRGFTSYFLHNRRPYGIASLLTPKSLGEPIDSLADIHNGDGLSFFTAKGEYTGFLVNGIKNGRLIPNRPVQWPRDVNFFRTTDVAWQRLMASNTSSRTIWLDINLFQNRIEALDERGCRVVLSHQLLMQEARKPQNLRQYFEKLGGTIYRLRNFENHIGEQVFVPASALTSLRRELISALDTDARITYRRGYRLPEDKDCLYPATSLDYRDNVANRLAADFYKSHGIKKIEPAIEVSHEAVKPGTTVMTTRHCILRELGLCLREQVNKEKPLKLPLILKGASRNLLVYPDCTRCEMQIKLGK